jgi:hypothetical protein
MIANNGDQSTLSGRMRAVRVDLFGEDGAFTLASLLGVSEGSLTRMETEGPIPGHLMLAFIEVTEANPRWLLSGSGERYLRFTAGGRAGGRGSNRHRVVDAR